MVPVALGLPDPSGQLAPAAAGPYGLAQDSPLRTRHLTFLIHCSEFRIQDELILPLQHLDIICYVISRIPFAVDDMTFRLPEILCGEAYNLF